MAKKHFAFDEEAVDSVLGDAYDFVEKCKDSFDMLFMDVNFTAEDPSISPPWKFLEKDFIQKLLDLSDTFVTINVLCYSGEAK